MTQWISVQDQLPLLRSDVLISDGKAVGIGYLEDNYGDLSDEAFWYQEGILLSTCIYGYPIVTHWMLLPAPPEVKNE